VASVTPTIVWIIGPKSLKRPEPARERRREKEGEKRKREKEGDTCENLISSSGPRAAAT
jgi:hypothetical protein